MWNETGIRDKMRSITKGAQRKLRRNAGGRSDQPLFGAGEGESEEGN